MLDPYQIRTQFEKYVSHCLQKPVEFIGAEELPESTRQAPWRVDFYVDGHPHSFVFQFDARGIEYEYAILKAMEKIQIPTPHAYGLDMEGKALGTACFFSDYLDGHSLLAPLQAGEKWAEDLYIKSVCALQAVTEEELGEVSGSVKREPIERVLENAYQFFREKSLPLADAAYNRLIANKPLLPPPRFSNGDLWLDNFITKDKELVGIIDFQGAAFSDPIYEFLLSFFVAPELQNRGIEARFCQHTGYDPAILHWYHGLEFFDTWHWLLKTGEDFVHHTAESVEAHLKDWMQTAFYN